MGKVPISATIDQELVAWIKTKLKVMEGIRPDTVTMSHHYGFWVHPWAKEKGPTPNVLFPVGEGYISNTADQSFHVRVKVTKA